MIEKTGSGTSMLDLTKKHIRGTVRVISSHHSDSQQYPFTFHWLMMTNLFIFLNRSACNCWSFCLQAAFLLSSFFQFNKVTHLEFTFFSRTKFFFYLLKDAAISSRAGDTFSPCSPSTEFSRVWLKDAFISIFLCFYISIFLYLEMKNL